MRTISTTRDEQTSQFSPHTILIQPSWWFYLPQSKSTFLLSAVRVSLCFYKVAFCQCTKATKKNLHSQIMFKRCFFSIHSSEDTSDDTGSESSTTEHSEAYTVSRESSENYNPSEATDSDDSELFSFR